MLPFYAIMQSEYASEERELNAPVNSPEFGKSTFDL